MQGNKVTNIDRIDVRTILNYNTSVTKYDMNCLYLSDGGAEDILRDLDAI